MGELAPAPRFVAQPEVVAGLEGQVYVVLRPRGSVESLFRDTLRRLTERFPDLPATHPNSAHVTFRGYPVGADSLTIGRVVDRWASELPPLLIEVDAITVFPAPFKIVILKVEKTPELRQAFTRLLDLSESAGLPYLQTVPRTADAWIFHVSTLYCATVEDEAWSAVGDFVAQLEAPPARDTVAHAELVRYSGGHEYTRVVPFGRVATL